MRTAASILFGHPGSVQSRPNVFGELMRVIISPSQAVEEAVNLVLNGVDPDITLHMRMLMNRYCKLKVVAKYVSFMGYLLCNDIKVS